MCVLKKMIPEKTIYHILLLCILVMLIYYPAINSEISIIDDMDMVNALLNTEHQSFWDIFIPRASSGGYYRPLLGLSQYIDKRFWAMDSTFMHLENILFHLVNAVLVYLLALRVLVRLSFNCDRLVPLVAAVIFAIHPIATESVDWISGRTDSMACNFILISTIFIFRYHDNGKKLNLFFFSTSLLFSLLAKEVAFGYLLALPFLLSFPRYDVTQAVDPVVLSTRKPLNPYIVYSLFFSVSVIIVLYVGSYWSVLLLGCCYLLLSLWLVSGEKTLQMTIREHFVATSIFAFVVLATCALFFVLRKIAFSSNIDRISNTLQLIFQDTSYAISIFLGAAGFYVKKFFLPWPLNFFILEIDPLYDLLGIAVFLLVLWLVTRRNTISALTIAGICSVLPAFPFAFATIAWTGYAERYIYVASAFWSIAVTFFVAKFLIDVNLPYKIRWCAYASVIPILIVMTIITFQRNLTWRTNMALISNTVALNPSQKELRGLLMLAYIRVGDLKSAREQYRIASSLHNIKYIEHIELNMAGIEASEGNNDEAEVLLKRVLNNPRAKPVIALNFYIKFLENELILAKDLGSISTIQNKIIPLYNKLYDLNHDPFILYRLGQIYIARKDKDEAIQMFERAVQAYPPGNMYGDNSKKIVKKMKRQI